MTRGSGGRKERGMTNLVGVVLVVGLTLVGAIAVVVVGTVALQSVSDQTQDDVAQDSMQEMSARLATVADSPINDNTQFRMPGTVNVSSASVSIAATNGSIDNIPTNPDDQDSVGVPSTAWVSPGPRPLGTIVYDRSDGTRLAYQGGGVWSAGEGQTMIVSRPQLDYDGATVDFSIVNVSRAETITHGGDVVARKDVEESRQSGAALRSVLQDAWTTSSGTARVNVTVTIQSPYADGWARYANTSMTVSPETVRYWPGNDTVRMEFESLGSDTSGGGGGGGGGPGDGSGDGDDCDGDNDAGHGNDCGDDPDNPGNGGSGGSSDDALVYEPGQNALQVNQEEGELTLLTAQIGNPVETEVVVDDAEYRDPMDVVFAIDETGSMTDNDPDDKRIDATESFIDSLNASNGDRTGFVQFTTRDYIQNCYWSSDGPYCDYTYPDPAYEGIVDHHDLTSNFASVESDLDPWADGYTNITRGLDAATSVHTNETDPNEQRVTVLLTDGQNTGMFTSDEETIAAAERAHDQHGITVYTVGLSDEADQDLLEDVADAGDGEFYYADNADDLEDIFDQIADEARTENVTRINRTHTVLTAEQDVSETIEVDGESNVNHPDYFADPTGIARSYDLSNFQPGGYLSFTVTLQSCTDYETTDVEQNDGTGTLYRHAYCAAGGATETTIDNSNSDHMVFRDGDSVSELTALDTDWWHSDPASVLPAGYVSGNTFDLLPEESIIALNVQETASGQSGYVLLHFEVDELETEDDPGGGGGSTPPDSDDSSVSGGSSPGAPITIGYSEVTIS